MESRCTRCWSARHCRRDSTHQGRACMRCMYYLTQRLRWCQGGCRGQSLQGWGGGAICSKVCTMPHAKLQLTRTCMSWMPAAPRCHCRLLPRCRLDKSNTLCFRQSGCACHRRAQTDSGGRLYSWWHPHPNNSQDYRAHRSPHVPPCAVSHRRR